MIILLAPLACAETCLSTAVAVVVAEDYSGPELEGVSTELQNGRVELAYDSESQRWVYQGPGEETMNPLASATLVFDGSEEALDVSDFVETSGGGGHTCENFFYDYVLEDAE